MTRLVYDYRKTVTSVHYHASQKYTTFTTIRFITFTVSHIHTVTERYEHCQSSQVSIMCVSVWWVNNIELYHAHKLLTTILSLRNYCQEVFRPRLKFPGWAMPTLIFSRVGACSPCSPVPAPMPLRGEKPDFWPVSKNNTGSLPLGGNPAGNKTRSSADADNRLDAFIGQSRSTNMVPFHMLYMVSYCAIVTLSLRHAVFLRYSSSKNFMTLKWGSKVTQGHWECYHSIDCVWFPISVL